MTISGTRTLPIALCATLDAWLEDPTFREAWSIFCDEASAAAHGVKCGRPVDGKHVNDAIQHLLHLVEDRAATLAPGIVTQQ